jgi:alpha,alpha-trehalase
MTEVFFIEQLSPLYEAVQSAGIFPDSKFFPDCGLLATPEGIRNAYERARAQPGFDLKKFVETHFEMPPETGTGYESADKPIAQHLENLWDVLLRPPAEKYLASTLIPLPYPYIVPGGRFREVYYWDSYFTMLGLRAAGRTDLIRYMTDNFAHLIDTAGFIPNGNRTYYLSRSQPPFFALIVHLLSDLKGPEILLRYRPQLEKEYAFWMAGENVLNAEQPAHRRVVRLPDGAILNRYWDDRDTPRPEAYVEDVHLAAQSDRPAAETYRHIRAAAESGWDFSSRWFADGQNMATIRTTELLPVDLNCLLYFLEKTLLNIYRQLPDRVPADVFKEKARQRKQVIQQYFWDEKAGFFFDFDLANNSKSNNWNAAALFPLFFNIATDEQAAQVARHVENKFLHPGGLVTTLSASGQQWDAPNGWAPLQWIAYRGLLNYGHDALADRLRERWTALNEKTYAETGKMMEKYNVTDIELKAGGGEYPNQDGFGWTNGVYLGMEGGLQV